MRFPCLVGGRILRIAGLVACVASPALAASDDGLVVEGFTGLQTRAFLAAPLHEGQVSSRVSSLVVLSPKLRYRDEDAGLQFVFNPKFARELDAYDSRRNSFDVQEAKLTWRGDGWWVVGGNAIVHWGKLESRQIVDIVNQRDLALAMDPNDKLGQPMINVGTRLGGGALDLYWLPYFRKGTFPGTSGRLRGNIPIDVEQSTYTAGAKRSQDDFAVRYSAAQGPIDLGVAFFTGTGREPRMVLGRGRRDEEVLVPHYDVVTQISADAQATLGPALLKLELARRRQNGEHYTMSGLGIEYSYFNVRQSNADIALIIELLRDTRTNSAPPSTFDSEAFVGFRTSFNDINDTSLLGGLVIDRNTGSRAGILNFETRLFQRLSLKVQLQTYSGTRPSELVLHQLRRDDNLRVSLNYYF